MSKTKVTTLTDRIRAMNHMYALPVYNAPILHLDADERLENFEKILCEEIEEIEGIKESISGGLPAMSTLVKIADWLGDIVVYCHSEAMKYGIPLEQVLEIIMESNMSKLGEDGKPIHDERGKFLKGPNYWRPEPKIRELLLSLKLNDPSEGGNCD